MSRRMSRPILMQATCLLSFLVLAACRGRHVSEEGISRPEAVVDPVLRSNRVSALPSPVYQSQAKSPIFWQPWSQETLALAKESRRLLFVVVALPQHGSYQRILESIAMNPRVTAVMNHECIPVLIDADACREIGLLMEDLCSEIQRPLQMPVFMWMTHEGNPVAWAPVAAQAPREVCDLFDQSHATVGRVWRDDPDYVLRNSASDNLLRKERMVARRTETRISEKPEQDVVVALRQLTALYDPYSAGFDQAGTLVPAGLLELLAVVSRHPSLPDDLRSKSRSILIELSTALLPSAMFDPLDGGVFSSRRGSVTWSAPSFLRDCLNQARIVSALSEVYQTTGDRFALERAQGILNFAEQQYRTADGLYTLGGSDPGPPDQWMWTVEQIREILPADHAEWWIRESRVNALGNLPSEADPLREFFRSNTLALSKPIEQLAEQSGMGRESFLAMFESSRHKLLEARNKRLEGLFRDASPHAASTFRMVSAYAAMFTATKDDAHREKAVELLNKAREAFQRGRFLSSMKQGAADSISMARAFPHALALQAALDVAAITDLPEWKLWAEDLATVSAELFADEGFVRECPPSAEVIPLPIADRVMLFDDTSLGLFAMAEVRLAALERPMVRHFREIVSPLPTYFLERPVSHTDLILAALLRSYPITVTQGENLSGDLQSAVHGLSIRSVLRRDAKAQDQVPAGAIQVSGGSGAETILRNPDELRQWFTGQTP
jgi:uncharacterized protein YyaL (SSP411 family)